VIKGFGDETNEVRNRFTLCDEDDEVVAIIYLDVSSNLEHAQIEAQKMLTKYSTDPVRSLEKPAEDAPYYGEIYFRGTSVCQFQPAECFLLQVHSPGISGKSDAPQ
jgi:hypothetical protein